MEDNSFDEDREIKLYEDGFEAGEQAYVKGHRLDIPSSPNNYEQGYIDGYYWAKEVDAEYYRLFRF